MKVSDICRGHGISIPTFHNWKSKYSGMDVNQLKKLKELEVENARLLKRMKTAVRLMRFVVKWGSIQLRFTIGERSTPDLK